MKITIDVITMVFLGSLLVASFFKSTKSNKGEYFLRLLCGLLLISLASNAVYGLADIGIINISHGIITLLGGSVQYVCAVFMPFVYLNYIVQIIMLPDIVSQKIRRITWIGVGVGVLCVIFRAVTGLLEQSHPELYNVHRVGMIVNHAFLMVAFLADFIFVIYNHKRLDKISMTIMLVSFLLPAIGAFVQFKHDQIHIVYLVMALSTFLIFFTVKNENERRVTELQKEVSQMQVDIMMSQIQPHFLYNSLTTIAALCEKNPQMAKSATESFSQYFQNTIKSIKSTAPIPFSDELEHVKHYFALEKLRFGDCINLELDLQVTDFMIPPLSIQPIVENAIKYGICSEPGRKGSVLINSRDLKNIISVTITDNGRGFDKNVKKNDGRQHIGIENVRKRVEAIGGSFSIDSQVGSGTTVVIMVNRNLPLEN